MTDRKLHILTSFNSARRPLAGEKVEPFEFLDTAVTLADKVPLYYFDKPASDVCIVTFPSEDSVNARVFGNELATKDKVKEHEHRLLTLPKPPQPEDFYLYDLGRGDIIFQSWEPEHEIWEDVLWNRFSMFPKGKHHTRLVYSRADKQFYRMFGSGNLAGIAYAFYSTQFMLKSPDDEESISRFGFILAMFLQMKKYEYHFKDFATWYQIKDLLNLIDPKGETKLLPRQIERLDEAWSYHYGEKINFGDQDEETIEQFFREHGQYSLKLLAETGSIPFCRQETDILVDIPALNPGVLSATTIAGTIQIFYNEKRISIKDIREILDLDDIELYPILTGDTE